MNHRLLPGAAALMLVMLTACSRGSAEDDVTAAPSDSVADTAAVRARYLSGIEAFNAHDLEQFMRQFAIDVNMYTPTGWLRGKAAVSERFAGTFKQFPQVRMVVDSLRVRSVAQSVTVVDFRWRVYPMGAGPAFHGVGSGVYVLRAGDWVEVLEHETVTRTDPELLQPPASPPE